MILAERGLRPTYWGPDLLTFAKHLLAATGE